MNPWIKAARIPSQLYLASSLFLGHALYYKINDQINWLLVSCFALFGIFLQLYIVFGNDVADFETDKLNKTSTIFSGGSRVLVEQSLTLAQLKFAHLLMTGLSLAMGFILGLWLHSWAIFLLCIFALLLLWMYSHPPIKLSYRGGGEFLQAIGLGIVLPIMAFIGQGGGELPLQIILALIPSHLACAMGTSLADEPSDRLSQKRTFAVIYGQWKACLSIAGLQVLSMLLLLLIDLNSYLLKDLRVLTYFGCLILIFISCIKATPGSSTMNLKILSTILFTQSLIAISILNCFI